MIKDKKIVSVTQLCGLRPVFKNDTPGDGWMGPPALLVLYQDGDFELCDICSDGILGAIQSVSNFSHFQVDGEKVEIKK